MSCPLSEIFGRPGEGVHAPRVFGLAFVDLALTAGAAYGISRMGFCSFWVSLLILICIGVITHYVTCVPTALNVALGLADAPTRPHPHMV